MWIWIRLPRLRGNLILKNNRSSSIRKVVEVFFTQHLPEALKMFLTHRIRLVLQSTLAVVAIAAYAGATILYAGVNEVGSSSIIVSHSTYGDSL